MKCCLCGDEIGNDRGWDKGNNAQPVMEGRCCDECNMSVVIPRRFNEAREWQYQTMEEKNGRP